MAFSYKASITIDHTKCGSADSSNFPVVVSGTYDGTGGVPNLKSAANGGHVQNANGYDIYFYSDSSLTTRIPAERVTYNASTGAVQFWVQVGTLSHTTNTVIYIAYDDSSISTDPNSDATYGKTKVWDTNFKGVYHHDDASGNAIDSTSNSNDLTATIVSGHINYGVAAEVGNGETLNQAAPAYFQRASTLIGSTDISGFMWVHLTSNSMSGAFFHNGSGSGNGDGFSLGVGNTQFDNTGNNLILLLDAVAWENTATAIGTGWHYVGLTRSSSDSIWRFYIDGVAAGPTNIGNNPSTPTANFAIGYDVSGAPRTFADTVDESQFSSVVRTPSWILSSYNNQNSPSTFYTMGSETNIGGGGTTHPRYFTPGFDRTQSGRHFG